MKFFNCKSMPNSIPIEQLLFPRNQSNLIYAGVRFVPPIQKMFMPGIFCKIIVELLAKLGVSWM